MRTEFLLVSVRRGTYTFVLCDKVRNLELYSSDRIGSPMGCAERSGGRDAAAQSSEMFRLVQAAQI